MIGIFLKFIMTGIYFNSVKELDVYAWCVCVCVFSLTGLKSSVVNPR